MKMTYELTPTNGRKSFYRKAMVEVENGNHTLLSYGTKICTRTKDGRIIRHYFGKRTNTTCAHVKSFLGNDYKSFWEMKGE